MGPSPRKDTLMLFYQTGKQTFIKVLSSKPQTYGIFTSCGGLRVFAAQQLLASLLARALFLGCSVLWLML